jgi:hypothetical protein
MIDLKSIWEAIERFCKDTNEERLIWARIAVLQTYCEGCLRRVEGANVDVSDHTHHPANHTQGNLSFGVDWYTRR